MAVRTSAPITFTPGLDFFRTDRGVFWGIKVTDTSEVDTLTVFVKHGEQWAAGASLAGFEWEKEMQPFGSIRAWLRAKVVPALNQWLASQFPAQQDPNTPPKFETLAQELDWIIVNELKVTQNADGTLTASLP